MTISELVEAATAIPKAVPVGLSADECLKCNVCTTVCPVARVTDLFPGPKYAGPQAQRARLGTLQSPGTGPLSVLRVARPDRRLVLGLRDVHDGLPGRRQDRRDEQPGPGGLARRATGRASATGSSARPTSPDGSGVRTAPLANWSLHNRAVPGAAWTASSGSIAGRRCPASAGRTFRLRARPPPPVTLVGRCTAAGSGRRLLPRLRHELLRAARRPGGNRCPRAQRLRRSSCRPRSAAACP